MNENAEKARNISTKLEDGIVEGPRDARPTLKFFAAMTIALIHALLAIGDRLRNIEVAIYRQADMENQIPEDK